MLLEWRHSELQLKYRLGELTMFSAKFNALTCGKHFSELKIDQADWPAKDIAKRDVQVCITRSQPVSTPLPKFRLHGGWIRYVPRTYNRYFVDLRGSFNDYLKKFSSKTRSTLARKVRKFADAHGGQVDIREYRTPEEVEIFLSAARTLSSKTYQERLLASGLPEDSAFRTAAIASAAQGRVRAYLLYLSGNAVAFVYCPVEDGVLIYEYVGYDPAVHHLSPGTVLQYLLLKRLFDEGGYRMFDFTEGEGAHKALFATDYVPCADVHFYRLNARNVAAVGFHLALTGASDGLVYLLDRLGLKALIKRALRRVA